MKRSLLAAPDQFSLQPLLCLLPVQGQIGKLETLTSSLFARYEKVNNLIREFGNDDQASKRFIAEQQMLRQVLDWLDVSPEEQAEE